MEITEKHQNNQNKYFIKAIIDGILILPFLASSSKEVINQTYNFLASSYFECSEIKWAFPEKKCNTPVEDINGNFQGEHATTCSASVTGTNTWVTANQDLLTTTL